MESVKYIRGHNWKQKVSKIIMNTLVPMNEVREVVKYACSNFCVQRLNPARFNYNEKCEGWGHPEKQCKVIASFDKRYDLTPDREEVKPDGAKVMAKEEGA